MNFKMVVPSQIVRLLAVMVVVSLWSSAVHCRVVGQLNDDQKGHGGDGNVAVGEGGGEDDEVAHGDDLQTDSASAADEADDASWPVLCPEDTYYDKVEEDCKVCSQCAFNQVITSPCYGLQDTQCGPFISFQPFGSSSGGDKSDKLDSDNNDEKKSEDFKKSESKSTRTEAGTRSEDSAASEIDSLESENEWLSLILVILLVIVSSVFLLVISITCYVHHKSTRSIKKVVAPACEYQPAPTPSPV